MSLLQRLKTWWANYIADPALIDEPIECVEKQILTALKGNPLTCATLSLKTGIPEKICLPTLLQLEMENKVSSYLWYPDLNTHNAQRMFRLIPWLASWS